MITSKDLTDAVTLLQDECRNNDNCTTCRLRDPNIPNKCVIQTELPSEYQFAHLSADVPPSIFK